MNIPQTAFLHLTAVALILSAGCRTTGPLDKERPATLSQKRILSQAARNWRQFQDRNPATDDRELSAAMQRVANHLQATVGETEETWEIQVFTGEPVTAFMLPPAYFAIQESLCRRLESDNQRAAILAHLLGHAGAVHGAERLGLLLQEQAPETKATGDDQRREKIGRLVMLAYTGYAEEQPWLAYSSQHEIVADNLAVMYMIRSGYNPRALLTTWATLDEAEDGVSLFLRTHPMTTQRRGHLEKTIARSATWY